MGSVRVNSVPASTSSKHYLPQKIPSQRRDKGTTTSQTAESTFITIKAGPQSGTRTDNRDGSKPQTIGDIVRIIPLAETLAGDETETAQEPEALDEALVAILEEDFSRPGNITRVLHGIDRIWRTGILFTNGSLNGASDSYLQILSRVAEENDTIFAEHLRRDLGTTFPKEFRALCRKREIRPAQRTIAATQALELALLGVDPSRILSRINSTRGSHANGYVNELQAGWFLAKFVYRFRALEGTSLILSRDFPEKEVDILTPTEIGEIKSAGNHLVSQLCMLLALVAANNKLRHRIERIIVVKNGTPDDQLSICGPSNGESDELKADLIEKIRSAFEREDISTAGDACLHRLVSPSGILFYLTPQPDNFEEVGEWVRQNYAVLDGGRGTKSVA